MGKLPDRRTILRLFKLLEKAPPNVASLTLQPDGSFECTFRGAEPARDLAETSMGGGASVKRVPGSIFPDDESPIDAADLVLNPIDLSEDAN